MIECWHEVANRRPQFPEIHQRLHNWYAHQTFPNDSLKKGRHNLDSEKTPMFNSDDHGKANRQSSNNVIQSDKWGGMKTN